MKSDALKICSVFAKVNGITRWVGIPHVRDFAQHHSNTPILHHSTTPILLISLFSILPSNFSPLNPTHINFKIYFFFHGRAMQHTLFTNR